VFGASCVEVEVAAVALEAFAESEGRPVGGFVKGAGMMGGVVEALGVERTGLVLFFPFVLEGAQAEVVAFSQGEAQSLNLLAPGDGAQNEVAGVFGEPAGFQGDYGEPILHFERLLISEIALINQPSELRGGWSIALFDARYLR
jgi:hypothetical protein